MMFAFRSLILPLSFLWHAYAIDESRLLAMAAEKGLERGFMLAIKGNAASRIFEDGSPITLGDVVTVLKPDSVLPVIESDLPGDMKERKLQQWITRSVDDDTIVFLRKRSRFEGYNGASNTDEGVICTRRSCLGEVAGVAGGYNCGGGGNDRSCLDILIQDNADGVYISCPKGGQTMNATEIDCHCKDNLGDCEGVLSYNGPDWYLDVTSNCDTDSDGQWAVMATLQCDDIVYADPV